MKALLGVKQVSLEALGLFLVMLQAAGPEGGAGDRSLWTARYSRLFTKRLTKDKADRLEEELVSAGLIPEKGQVYGLEASGIMSPEERAGLERALEALREEVRVRPPQEKEHNRLYGALLATESLEVCSRLVREPVEEGSDVLVADGARVYRQRWAWDYAYAGRLLRDHGLRRLLDVLFSIHSSGAFDRMEEADPLGRQHHMRSYLMAVLLGSKTTTSDERWNAHF